MKFNTSYSQFFYKDQNSDLDKYFTLMLIPELFTLKTPTKLSSNSQTSSKFTVSTDRTNRQTKSFTILFLLLEHPKHVKNICSQYFLYFPLHD